MRLTGTRVADRLLAGGYSFEFHEASRMLARWASEEGYSFRDFVRFRSLLSTSFPPSEIYEILRRENAEEQETRLDVTVAHFGLFGAQGVMPIHFTEKLIARKFARDPALQEFLDLFNNRLTHLFQEAWERSRFYIPYERGRIEQSLSGYLFDIIGLGTGHLRGRTSLKDESLLYYAGLLAQKPRNSGNLANLLGDYFGVPVEVSPFHGGWYELSSAEQTCLGRRDRTTRLGEGAVAGDAIWIHHSRFMVQVGPVGLRHFRGFLPGGPLRRELADLTRFFVGLEKQFELRLVLKTEEVPPMEITDDETNAPRLGWSSWLGADPHREAPAMPCFSMGNEPDLM